MNTARENIKATLEGTSKVGSVYETAMTVVIIVSFVPLIFKETTPILAWIDHIAAAFFILDYILRWMTSGLRFKKRWMVYVLYPVSPWALLDLVCILPSFHVIPAVFRLLKVARLPRTTRVFRTLRTLRDSNSYHLIMEVIKHQIRALIMVFAIALAYILIVAVIMFNVEPDTFDNFFVAVYWSVISLTTIGYGDVLPVSTVGQVFTIISAFVGVAIIALPSGIIAGGFMDQIRRRPRREERNKEGTGGAGEIRENTARTKLSSDPIVQLRRVDTLHRDGILTEEEYSAKKAELLARI